MFLSCFLMMRKLFFLIALLPTLLFCTDIVVSIPPTRYIVQRIVGHSLSIEVLVPPGLSPHSFEPNAKEILDVSQATVWFQIGECFEKRVTLVFPGSMKKVNLLESINIKPTFHDDTHIWMTTKLIEDQANAIHKSLASIYPEKEDLFTSNLEKFKNELHALNEDIKNITKSAPNKTVLVVHPAFGHFCKEYGFTQLSIEDYGREPSPKYLQELLKAAQKAKINRIFIAPEYSTKEALVLARELGAKLVTIDPYREDVLANLKEIAIQFSE